MKSKSQKLDFGGLTKISEWTSFQASFFSQSFLEWQCRVHPNCIRFLCEHHIWYCTDAIVYIYIYGKKKNRHMSILGAPYLISYLQCQLIITKLVFNDRSQESRMQYLVVVLLSTITISSNSTTSSNYVVVASSQQQLLLLLTTTISTHQLRFITTTAHYHQLLLGVVYRLEDEQYLVLNNVYYMNLHQCN